MWGNWQGWSISALLVGIMVWLVWMLGQANALSAPSDFGKSADTLAVLSLPIAPQSIVPMPHAEDAAPLFRQAIGEYLATPDRYDNFREKGKASSVPSLTALKLLVDSTELSRCTLCESSLADVLNYKNEKPPLDALKVLSDCAVRAALLIKTDQPNEAKQYFQAVFAMGAKLFNERVTAREMRLGLEMMAAGSGGLKGIAEANGDTAAVAQLEEFDKARADYFKVHIEPVIKVLLTIDSNSIARHPGDYFYIAERAAERLWRVEAILAIGRLRFNIGTEGRVGDQRGALTVLKRVSNDPDPIIRQAAKVASELTQDQYRVIRDLM